MQGVPAAKFIATSKSFGVDSQVRIDEEKIKQYGVDRTPTIIVNGKYRLVVASAGRRRANDRAGELAGGEGKQIIAQIIAEASCGSGDPHRRGAQS